MPTPRVHRPTTENVQYRNYAHRWAAASVYCKAVRAGG
jgi:hypothetical protein